MKHKANFIDLLIIFITVLSTFITFGLILQICNFMFNDTPSEPKIIYLSKFPVEYRTAIVTAYTSDPAETDDTPFVTASGERVGPGVIACPRDIPFGTEVIIADKVYTCLDRMAKKNDGKFDIWMESKRDAIIWGENLLEVKILYYHE